MNDGTLEQNQVDGVLLGWLLVWSLVLSLTVCSFGLAGDDANLSGDGQFLLASSLGGLAATWTVIATWLSLIHVPARAHSRRHVRRFQFGMTCFLLINAIGIAITQRSMPSITTQLMLMASVSSLGPFLIWQWFRRPIHRGLTPPTGQRSIRQILGMAITIAFANVLFKIASVWMDLSQAMVTLVLSIAVGWTLLLLAMLGRQWAWIFGLIPLCIGQPFAVLLVMGMESNDADEQAMTVAGTFFGFYLFAMLYLVLLRSSGHNWFRSTCIAEQSTTATSGGFRRSIA